MLIDELDKLTCESVDGIKQVKTNTTAKMLRNRTVPTRSAITTRFFILQILRETVAHDFNASIHKSQKHAICITCTSVAACTRRQMLLLGCIHYSLISSISIAIGRHCMVRYHGFRHHWKRSFLCIQVKIYDSQT